MAAFDWYQATVPAPVDDVLEALLGLSERATLLHTKGHNGYAHSTVVAGSDGPVGAVWHGGTHEHPHAYFTGDQADEGSQCIRAAFPEHYVTRFDPRVDFIDATAYERIQNVMIDVSREYRVKPRVMGDHLVHQQGRTFMLGSASSVVQERLYEKTAEQRAKFASDPARLAAIPDHWVRLEAQIRPQTRGSRLLSATLHPVAAMGSSPWLREVWRRVQGTELQPVQLGKVWRQADDERAYTCLLAQYGGLLQRMAEDHGSFCALGSQIGHDLSERAKAKRR